MRPCPPNPCLDIFRFLLACLLSTSFLRALVNGGMACDFLPEQGVASGRKKALDPLKNVLSP